MGRDEDEISTIQRHVVDRYRRVENKGFTCGEFVFEKCCDVISTLVSDQGKTSFFIIALDECTNERTHLLSQGFNEILGKPSPAGAKLLISSWDTPHLAMFCD